MKIIEVKDLVKNYGSFKAVKGISFDVYEGDKLPTGKKAYSVSFMLQDTQQTLTDQVIDKTMQRLMTTFEEKVGAMIRK